MIISHLSLYDVALMSVLIMLVVLVVSLTSRSDRRSPTSPKYMIAPARGHQHCAVQVQNHPDATLYRPSPSINYRGQMRQYHRPSPLRMAKLGNLPDIQVVENVTVDTVKTYSNKSPFTGRIASRIMISETPEGTTWQLLIDRCRTVQNDEPFLYVEGQALGILDEPVNKDKPKTSFYSIACDRYGDTLAGESLSLCVFEPKDKTNNLLNAPLQAVVKIVGPFGGKLSIPDPLPKNMLCICAGTGIAPYRSIAQRLFGHQSHKPMDSAVGGGFRMDVVVLGNSSTESGDNSPDDSLPLANSNSDSSSENNIDGEHMFAAELHAMRVETEALGEKVRKHKRKNDKWSKKKGALYEREFMSWSEEYPESFSYEQVESTAAFIASKKLESAIAAGSHIYISGPLKEEVKGFASSDEIDKAKAEGRWHVEVY